MGAHGLGAAAYAVEAVQLAEPDRPQAADEEVCWQLDHMSPELRRALRALPPLDENRAGPLGPGLLSRGQLATTIRRLQGELASADG
jgi:hypothetical protein